MAENGTTTSNRTSTTTTRRSTYVRRRATDPRRTCCSTVQYRAISLISLCVMLIFVAEYWNVAYYLIFVGSVGIFMGVFLILLDVSLYLQAKNERDRRRRRFCARDEEEAENGGSSVWTTSQSDPYSGQPPDYQTTISQPELFPFPSSYLQDGVPATQVTSSATDSEDGVVTYENGVEEDDDENKLPSYAEVMRGARIQTVRETAHA